ncbi:MAG TPA: hypothetical protein VNO51_13145 [Ilumatobacteraceae bacterium]|nr:hypothetical protein [Ilumatobacteraceae bacterium]
MASGSVRLAHVIAHQGGWDEMALVAGPIVVIIAVLAVVKRRVDHSTAETVTDATSVGDNSSPDRDAS